MQGEPAERPPLAQELFATLEDFLPVKAQTLSNRARRGLAEREARTREEQRRTDLWRLVLQKQVQKVPLPVGDAHDAESFAGIVTSMMKIRVDRNAPKALQKSLIALIKDIIGMINNLRGAEKEKEVWRPSAARPSRAAARRGRLPSTLAPARAIDVQSSPRGPPQYLKEFVGSLAINMYKQKEGAEPDETTVQLFEDKASTCAPRNQMPLGHQLNAFSLLNKDIVFRHASKECKLTVIERMSLVRRCRTRELRNVH